MYKWLNKALLQDCCLFPSQYHCVAHPGLELRPASCLSLPEAGTAGLSHHTQATLQMVSIRIFLPKTQPTSFLLLRPRFVTCNCSLLLPWSQLLQQVSSQGAFAKGLSRWNYGGSSAPVICTGGGSSVLPSFCPVSVHEANSPQMLWFCLTELSLLPLKELLPHSWHVHVEYSTAIAYN